MSDPMTFDIYAFDPALLDIPALLAGIADSQNASAKLIPHTDSSPMFGGGWEGAGWQITQISSNAHRTLYRADPDDMTQFPVLALKCYHRHDRPRATHEYKVLQALLDFGLNLAPVPFYANETPDGLHDPILICEWVHGEPLRQPPHPNEEDRWHRIMSALGVPNHLPFGKYASTIPMRGSGSQSPADLIRLIEDELAHISQNHPQYETLAALISRLKNRVAPEWNMPPKIGLNHLDPLPHHFIWDGHHLRLVGWQDADWADAAYAVGQLCAHPAYEEVSSSHWVWYRWELARLTHDENLVARATLYTNLMQALWAVKLVSEIENATDAAQQKRLSGQQARYLKRAEKIFN